MITKVMSATFGVSCVPYCSFLY